MDLHFAACRLLNGSAERALRVERLLDMKRPEASPTVSAALPAASTARTFKRWSFPHWIALTAVALLLNAIVVRFIPYQYDTPSREIVATLFGVNGLEFLVWMPAGTFVLVRFWRTFPIPYRIILAIDLVYVVVLILYFPIP